MRKKHLGSVEEVIEFLGGEEKVCMIADASLPAVRAWKAVLHKFPGNTYVVMTDALAKKGAVAPDSLWGMKAAKVCA